MVSTISMNCENSMWKFKDMQARKSQINRGIITRRNQERIGD